MNTFTSSKETMPGLGRPPRSSRGALALVTGIMLMDIVGLSLLYPVAAFIVQRYSRQALDVTLITVLYAAAQFVSAPLMGKLGDRFGRRPVLLISVAGQGLSYLVFGLGGALWVLFAARLVGGVTGGNLSTASAYIADVSKPEERTRNFMLVGVAWSVGLIVGPAMGAVLGQLSLQAPAFAAAALAMVNVLLGLVWLPESLPPELRRREPIRFSDFNPLGAIAGMARRPGLGRLLLGMSLFTFAFNGINSTGTLFVIQKFNAQPWQTGLLLGLAGVSLACVQLWVVQGLVARQGEQRVAILSLLAQTAGSVAIFFAPGMWLIYPLNMALSAASGLTFPTLTTLTTDRVPPHEVGMLLGVTTALGSLTNIVGPLWAGAVYDRLGIGTPYWMGALILVAAALVLAGRPARAPASGRAPSPSGRGPG
jgi:DHA1 family tetracycline resistance protein-like MFS transporter